MEGVRRSFAGAPLAVLLSAVVHYSVVSDFFMHDDFVHLYQIANHGFWEFLLTPHGGHLLATSNLVFYLCFQIFGVQAELYHGLALLTHLANVWLLFLVIERFTGKRVLALFGAALWGMSPVARGSIGWFSVYGHALATLGLLWVLLDVATVRRQPAAVSRGQMTRWFVLLILVAMCFGVGLGVAMASGAILYALLPNAPNRARVALVFGGMVLLLPLIYMVQHIAFEALWGPLLADGRDTIAQLGRDPLGPLLMLVRLVAFATASLVFGVVVRPDHGKALPPHSAALEGEIDLMSLVVALLIAIAVAWAALRSTRERRSAILGFGLIVLVAYGVIAAGRASLMLSAASSPLWMVSSPRYHYLGTLGIATVLCLALAALPLRFDRIGRLAFIVWVGFALPLDVHFARSIEGGPARASRGQYHRTVSKIRREVKARPEGGTVFIENRSFRPVRMLSLSRFPGEAAAFVFSFPENAVDGRRVYFVERRPEVLRAVARRPGTRIHDLVVSLKRKRSIQRTLTRLRDSRGFERTSPGAARPKDRR